MNLRENKNINSNLILTETPRVLRSPVLFLSLIPFLNDSLEIFSKKSLKQHCFDMLKGALSFEGLVTTSALHNNNTVYHSEQSIRERKSCKLGRSFGCNLLFSRKAVFIF